MNILLTNDDGYTSEGIKALYRSLSVKHKVYVLAPSSQKSAVGHGVTLNKSMKFQKIEHGFALDGTPADCVKVAVYGLFKEIKFDLVISGINNGANLGTDVFYSGTIAGAREGLLNNIPSIACSMCCPVDKQKFDSAAEIVEKLVSNLTDDFLDQKLILNINFPCKTVFREIKLTHLGVKIYNETIFIEDKNGISYASLMFPDKLSFISKENSDLDCIESGAISITPITNEHLSPPAIETISSILTHIKF